jgi:chemotaxis protein MotB
MRFPTILVFCLSAIVVLGACVSKSKYLELESDLVETQRSAEMINENLITVQSKKTDLEKDYETMRSVNVVLEDRNRELNERVSTLSDTLKNERSLIQEQDQVIQELQYTRQKIEAGLKEQIEAQEIRIEEMEGKLKVTFVDKILFNSGSASINPRGRESLLNFAQSFADSNGQKIVVEGHTDNVPVGSALQGRYPSNWELSTARATAVVRYLSEEAGLVPERLAASGYGSYRPVVANDTEEGRSQNRRIEIILVPVH